MVETITPVVHGGRGGRWAVVLVMHAAGATVAAALFGALLGAVGALLGAPWGVAGIALVSALAFLYLGQLFGIGVPVPQLRRQVPDWWRSFFPLGGAAFLYGVGLGVGFFTYLAHGTLVVVSGAALASGRPLAGAALLAPFGLARGLSAVVARRVRTADESISLVARLERSSSWAGWRIAHAAALVAVLAASVLATRELDRPGDIGGLAAAGLAMAFGAAGISKLVRGRTWRRTLAAYGLPRWLERPAAVAVPAVELGIAALPLLGLASTAGAVALTVLAAFSIAIVLARIRRGTRLECGCFGGTASRDYRWLLGRNLALAGVAFLAWREGVDASAMTLGSPHGGDLLPAALVVLGLALAAWVGVQGFAGLRGRAGR